MSKLPPRFRPAEAAGLVAAIDAIRAAVTTPPPLPVCDACGCLCRPDEACPGCVLAAIRAVVPDGHHRCGNCTGYFPVLVDDVLCVRCDAILYPSTTLGREAS